jgi:transcriptional regulator with GAF, ATPase, and Fis domain
MCVSWGGTALTEVTAPKPWLHFVGRDSCRLAPVIGEALTAAGLESRPLGQNEAGPGVLLFDDPSNELCDLVRQVSQDGRNRVVAIAVGSIPVDTSAFWCVLAAGASDVFGWEHSRQPAAEVAARFRRWDAVDQLVCSPLVADSLVGQSAVWRSVLRQIVEVARFTDVSMLVTGESGTGKELVARLVHTLDSRPGKRDLVVLDCTTVVPSLSGSEFFGHERGSFTGAISARDGAFAMADGGTLFLDEVGELSLGLQAELLRVVQEGSYKRVGSNTWRKTSFRLICATNRDLVQEERRGTFRRDFYHRIAAWRCHLPSLRERAEDILLLTRHFLRQFLGGEPPELDPPVRELLVGREYPGNVRDLRQLVARIAQRHVGAGPITVGDVPADERPLSGAADTGAWSGSAFETCIYRALVNGANLKEISSIARETAIRIALRNENGNLQRASRVLGVTDRALQLRKAAQRADPPPGDGGVSR